tara:strand:- start:112816 stop:113304 length:489 start_codon:yes stop_codon:yes gene_type:complete
MSNEAFCPEFQLEVGNDSYHWGSAVGLELIAKLNIPTGYSYGQALMRLAQYESNFGLYLRDFLEEMADEKDNREPPFEDVDELLEEENVDEHQVHRFKSFLFVDRDCASTTIISFDEFIQKAKKEVWDREQKFVGFNSWRYGCKISEKDPYWSWKGFVTDAN